MREKKSKSEDSKITVEKRERIEVEDVPLYRSYGVTKKVNLRRRRVMEALGKAWTVFFLGVELGLILFITFLFAFYTDVLVATTLFIVLFSIFFFNATKLIRRRARFLRRLKRACKKNGYALEFKRGFFKSLTWAKGDALDFTVKAGKWTYYVKLATSRRFLASFTFASKNQMKYTKIPRHNRFTIILDCKEKIYTMPIAFPAELDDKDKYSVKAILINPAVMNIYKKGSDGSTLPTGSGEKLFGYTIYTGTGFIETLKRNAEDEK